MKIGTVTLSRKASVPVKGSTGQEQNVFKGGGGEIRARDVGAEDRFVTYTIKNLVRTEFEDLRSFLISSSGAGYKKNAFDLVDDWSVTWSVRWWDNKIQYQEKLGRLFDVTLTFRIEN